jgi:hypothetical protein
VGLTNSLAAEFVREVGEAGFGAERFYHAQAFGSEAVLQTDALGVAEEEFDVPKFGKEGGDEVEEVGLVHGEGVIGEQLDEISEIITRVEGEPMNVCVEGEAGGSEKGAECLVGNADLVVALEVDARCFEKLDGGFRVHVLLEVEFEVEDPRARDSVEAGVHEVVGGSGGLRDGWVLWWAEVALGGPKSDADLDGLEDIYVAAEGLIVVFSLTACEVSDRPGDYAWKFGVHGNIGVFLDQLAQDVHLRFEVVPPDFPYSCCCACL